MKRRFLREAQVAARLRHPNVVTTHDIVTSAGASFIVMELVLGRTLESLLRERGRLPLDETAAILEQVAAALDYAHASDVVHRDVKPANIMVEPSGHVKVMDFGIAKVEAAGNLTATGLIMGTPNYMSPEQARGGKVDARSDLFSLGCVLYECLTGVRPFQADSVTAILVRILTEDPPPVDLAATGLPRAAEALLRRAMAKVPETRFPSGAKMIEALRAAAHGQPVSTGTATSARAVATRDHGTRTVVSGARARERAPAPRRLRRGLLLAAGVASLCLAGLAWIASDPYARSRPSAGASLVVEEPRGLLDRLLRRRPELRITVPAGTVLRLALEQPLSSETAEAGAGITAVTTSPLRIEGIETVPRGSRVLGRVSHALPAGRAEGRGELTLVFDALDSLGSRTALRTRPVAMRAPAPPRRREPARKGNPLLDGLSDVGGAVGGLIDRLRGTSSSVEGGKAEPVTVASANGREVTLPAQAPLAIELAEPMTLHRKRP